MVVAEKRFADPMPVAYGTIAFLAIGALLDIARLGSALTTVAFHPRSYVPYAEEHMFVRVLTMIAFAIWIERVWRNLPAFGETPDTSRTWAVLSFFVPPFCFYRPVLVVSEAWNESGGATSPPWFMQLATAWWVALMTPIATILVFRGRIIGFRGTMIVAEFFNIVAAGLAISVVYLLSMQQRRAAAARAVAQAAPAPALAIAVEPPGTPAAVSAQPTPTPVVPVAVATATRQVKTAAATMLERVVNAPRPSPNPLRLLDRIPPRIWQAALMFFSLIVAAALLLAAAELHFQRGDTPAALINCGLAVVLAAAALALRADKALLVERRRLAGLAAAGAAIAVVAFLAILEGLLR
jgi:hypothetical protein